MYLAEAFHNKNAYLRKDDDYKEYFDSTQNGIMHLDNAMRIKNLNREAERICGVERSYALGKPAKLVFHDLGEKFLKIFELAESIDNAITGLESDYFLNNSFIGILDFIKDSVLVAHNAPFDMGFLKQNAKNLGYEFDYTYLDTLSLAKDLFPDYKKYKEEDTGNDRDTAASLAGTLIGIEVVFSIPDWTPSKLKAPKPSRMLKASS